MKQINFTSILVSLSLIFYLLFLGASFFIPLLIAIVVWYLIITLTTSYKKIKIGKKNIPGTVAILTSILTMIFFLSLFMMLVNRNIENVIREAPGYQEKFSDLSNNIMNLVGVENSQGIAGVIEAIDISKLLKNIAGMFTTVAGYTSMIVIYTLFLLLEYQMIGKKIKLIFKKRESYEQFTSIVTKINKDIKTYIKIKTLASLSTAFLSLMVLLVVGVDFAVFWALLIFLLNYIPTVGSIVAVFFPILLSLIQFDTIIPFLIVMALLILIQIIIGNILEPKFMGKSLNLSPLVIILALTIWGSIWGVVGMFLCVPIMVILNIVLAKFEKTKPIAVMLSATGLIE